MTIQTVKSNVARFCAMLGLGLATSLSGTAFAAHVPSAQEQQEMMEKGMWYDARTGLIWDRCAVGQTWNGAMCTGESRKLTWSEANAFALQYKLGGYQNWSIPRMSQIYTLIDCQKTGAISRPIKYDNHEFYYRCAASENLQNKKTLTKPDTRIFPNFDGLPDKDWNWTSAKNYGLNYWTSSDSDTEPAKYRALANLFVNISTFTDEENKRNYFCTRIST